MMHLASPHWGMRDTTSAVSSRIRWFQTQLLIRPLGLGTLQDRRAPDRLSHRNDRTQISSRTGPSGLSLTSWATKHNVLSAAHQLACSPLLCPSNVSDAPLYHDPYYPVSTFCCFKHNHHCVAIAEKEPLLPQQEGDNQRTQPVCGSRVTLASSPLCRWGVCIQTIEIKREIR